MEYPKGNFRLMLRQSNTRPLHWTDKTMSVLRADQLEACEKDLAGLPSYCLFEQECTNLDAEKLYELSFFAEEDRRSSRRSSHSVLHTVEELRNRVLHHFVQETALLSVEEHDLLVRVVLFGGRTALADWNELLPARSLVRRLWCRVEGKGEHSVLVMPHQLCSSALLLLAADSHKAVRETVEKIHDNISNALYLFGAVHGSGFARHLQSLLKGTCAEDQPVLAERFLLAGYDYVYDHSGSLLLIHPGLADPERMMENSPAEMSVENMEAVREAADSINDLEAPLYDRMLSLLTDATRPEISPEDAVEDLIILAKQEVPETDMLEVLSSLLICQPTLEMRTALRALRNRIPRWLSLSTSQVQ